MFRGTQFRRADLARRIVELPVGVDLCGREIEPDRWIALAKFDSERQADVAQANDSDDRFFSHVCGDRIWIGEATSITRERLLCIGAKWRICIELRQGIESATRGILVAGL